MPSKLNNMAALNTKDFFSAGKVRVVGNEGTINKTESETGTPSFLQSLKQTVRDTVGDIKDTATEIKGNAQKRISTIKDIRTSMAEGKQGDVRSIYQATGQLAGGISDTFGSVLKGAGNILLSDKHEKDVTDIIGKYGAKVMAVPEVQNAINSYNALPIEKQRDIDAAGGIVSLIADIVGAGTASKGAKVAVEGIDTAIDTAKPVVSKIAKDTVQGVKNTVPATRDAFVEFVSPDIEDSVKNVLKNTPTDKFDNVVKIAQEASDPTKPSTYENVATAMSNATKQLEKQTKSLAREKSTIINKAKVGLADFTKETGRTILDINRALKNDPIGDSFIARLKQVKSKLDADKAIDELQDVLYKGNKDMTIPSDSKADKVLKGLLGKYNVALKSSLPESYGKINTSISNRIKALEILNKSLGEVVNGSPSRGAGLVKQFFSPAGTKTKKLFEYVKKTTGVDLAEDVILAKYVGEAFGDVKLKSLLEGLPTSKTGVIDKVVDFTLDKTGINSTLKKSKQAGMISKARKLTK